MKTHFGRHGRTRRSLTLILMSILALFVISCPSTSFLQNIEGKVNAVQGNAFSLTVTAGSGGSVSPAGTFTVANGGVTSIAATAGTNNGFVVWTVTSGSGVKFGNANAASTTVTLTGGNATIQANFGRIIETIAGNGTAGYLGDNGQAKSAELFDPLGITFDASGNLYFADNHNNVIRKIDATGTITTVAGNGTFGSSGNGGPATSASLGGPVSLAFDSSGNLFFSEFNNNWIRKVDHATGIITVWAGTGTAGYNGDNMAATLAELNEPTGITFNGHDNSLYIADLGNNRIRKVAWDGSNITTLAGNGTAGHSGDGGLAVNAELSSPGFILFDAAGNGYVGDTGNNCIRKIANSVINAFAGNATAGYSGDGGPATAAELSSPSGLAVDASGNLYIGDMGNNRVRKVSTSGIITTLAGTGGVGYAGDGGAAVLSTLNAPVGVAVDATGSCYIADSVNNRIRRVP